MLAGPTELVMGWFALNPSAWLMPIGRACGSEQGRGQWPHLRLENSSPDIYDYDGPSLVDLLWNINKLNRLQIIVTTDWSRAMDVFLSLSLLFSTGPDSIDPVLNPEHSNTVGWVCFGALMGRAVTLRMSQRKEIHFYRMFQAEMHCRLHPTPSPMGQIPDPTPYMVGVG